MSTEIKDKAGNPVGVLDGSGTVYDKHRSPKGAAKSGVVSDHSGRTVGSYDTIGEIKEGTTVVGYVKSGKVTGRIQGKLGSVSGPNPEAAGAALYFLFEQ